MKNKILFLFFGILAMMSCKTDDGPGIDMLYFEDFSMQAGLNPFVTHFYEFVLPTQGDFFLGNERENVDRITNSFARLTNNEGAPYDFVEAITLNVIDRNTGAIYEAAFREEIPFDTGSTLNLIPSLTDFKELLSGNEFDLQLRIRLRASPPFSIDRNRLDFGFRATLNE